MATADWPQLQRVRDREALQLKNDRHRGQGTRLGDTVSHFSGRPAEISPGSEISQAAPRAVNTVSSNRPTIISPDSEISQHARRPAVISPGSVISQVVPAVISPGTGVRYLRRPCCDISGP